MKLLDVGAPVDAEALLQTELLLIEVPAVVAEAYMLLISLVLMNDRGVCTPSISESQWKSQNATINNCFIIKDYHQKA